VCVCVRERECVRDRERENGCVRERERQTDRQRGPSILTMVFVHQIQRETRQIFAPGIETLALM
jgi:hypothetical protein